MDKIRVFIIDDHQLFREGLKKIIQADQGLLVVGEAKDGNSSIQLAKRAEPDVIILDISLPDMDGLQLAKRILSELDHVKILIVSMHSRREYVTTAFDSGVDGYVLKDSASDQLITGIYTVNKGDKYVDHLISHQLLQNLQTKRQFNPAQQNPLYKSLSDREMEVMRLLCSGIEVKEIGDILTISQKTVESHRYNLMKKLNVKNLVELVRYAYKNGLIDLQD